MRVCACQEHDDTAQYMFRCQLSGTDCFEHITEYAEDGCIFLREDKDEFCENILRIAKYKSPHFDFSNLKAVDYSEEGCKFVPIRKMHIEDFKNLFSELEYIEICEQMGSNAEIKSILYDPCGYVSFNGWLTDVELTEQDVERFELMTELFTGDGNKKIEDVLDKIQGIKS